MRMVYNYCLEDIKTIAVDFDGTLCEREKFPAIGRPKTELILWLKQQKKIGKKIILWTCREGETLREALQWSKAQGLEFDSVNENFPSNGIKTRKVMADIYIDDRSCIPLYEEL